MDDRKFVLGIDGGGTHLRLRAASVSDGKDLLSASFHSIGYFSRDPHKARLELSDIVSQFLNVLNRKPEDCLCIVCGMSGIDNEEDGNILKKIFEDFFSNAYVICMNDGLLALESTTGGRGILLNSGTGSIAVGINDDGKFARVGGWPYTVYGDEGSGTWISLNVIRFIGKWFDGLVDKNSILIGSVMKTLSIESEKNYMDFCLNFTQEKLSVIPPLVDDAASKGDAIAVEILSEAFTESFRLAYNIAKILSYKASDSFNVGIWGSNILKSPMHIDGFSKLFIKEFPNAHICLPVDDSITFATKKALQQIAL